LTDHQNYRCTSSSSWIPYNCGCKIESILIDYKNDSLTGNKSSGFDEEADVSSEYYLDHRFIALFAILGSLALIIIIQLIFICCLKRKNTQLEAKLKTLNIPTTEVEIPLSTPQHENDDVHYEVNEMYGIITSKEVETVGRHYRKY
jgi:hypothetical protein